MTGPRNTLSTGDRVTDGRPASGITPRELADWLARGEAVAVLDVREDARTRLLRDRRCRRLPSICTSRWAQIPSRLEELRAVIARCADRLVVYCHHGVRSRSVADWLARQGVERVFNLEGGIDAWSEVVDPGVPRY